MRVRMEFINVYVASCDGYVGAEDPGTVDWEREVLGYCVFEKVAVEGDADDFAAREETVGEGVEGVVGC